MSHVGSSLSNEGQLLPFLLLGFNLIVSNSQENELVSLIFEQNLVARRAPLKERRVSLLNPRGAPACIPGRIRKSFFNLLCNIREARFRGKLHSALETDRGDERAVVLHRQRVRLVQIEQLRQTSEDFFKKKQKITFYSMDLSSRSPTLKNLWNMRASRAPFFLDPFEDASQSKQTKQGSFSFHLAQRERRGLGCFK